MTTDPIDKRSLVDGSPEAAVHTPAGGRREVEPRATSHRPENGDPKPLDLTKKDGRPASWKEAMERRKEDRPVMDARWK